MNKKISEILKAVPEGYMNKSEYAGSVQSVDYETSDYTDGKTLQKRAWVYLPYGYDENKKYPIVYCLHGGEGNTFAYLGTEETPAPLKNVFDNMIANGDVKPFIAAAPSYYRHVGDNSTSVKDIEEFKNELINNLIPAVEGRYSTYAETTDLKGIKESRDYRAYAGYSMGSLSTWYTFVNCNEYFHYYMPMSGDCWVNGTQNPEEASLMLEKIYAASGFKTDEIFIYAVTGSDDIAYNPMKAQIEAMKVNSPSFRFISDECQEGNIIFAVEPGATHDYKFLPLYFYNVIPLFFDKR